MRRPLYPDFTALAPTVTCTCGTLVIRPPHISASASPRIVPHACARCWPRWVAGRLERAGVAGCDRAFEKLYDNLMNTSPVITALPDPPPSLSTPPPVS
jgi:hypothetical protein